MLLRASKEFIGRGVVGLEGDERTVSMLSQVEAASVFAHPLTISGQSETVQCLGGFWWMKRVIVE